MQSSRQGPLRRGEIIKGIQEISQIFDFEGLKDTEAGIIELKASLRKLGTGPKGAA
jgi:hypothetical protein